MPITFTPEQHAIFDFVKNGRSHGIIDAVAGAGKTTTIIESARHVKDRNILFCAFNKSIAIEIKNKFHRLGINDVTVKTIHALGWEMLKANNNTGNEITLVEPKYRELLKDPHLREQLNPYYEKIITLNGIDLNSWEDRQKFAAKNLAAKIDNRLLDINQKYRSTLTKDTFEAFQELVLHFGIFNEIEARKANFKQELSNYQQCHNILLEAGDEFSRRTMKIDFTDMLYLPFKWSLSPVTKYQFLFIDECQDLSKAQFAVAAKFGRQDGRILAVGDPYQSIYGFTGADIDSFNRVKEYTKATLLPLTTCFRCPQDVITMAQKFRPDITGSKKEPGTVKEILFKNVVEHARPGDLIISRIKSPLVYLIFDFIDKNIKVKIHDDEVHDIINELKNIFKQAELNVAIATTTDGFETIRQTVLKRWNWIIQQNAERIIDAFDRKLHIEEEKSYLEKKLSFLNRKYEQWKRECPTLSHILQRIKEYISATDNPIKLSTIHRAKGLENERVFIVNYDELPLKKTDQKEWEKIQELNLKYVAVTRSLNELFLVKSERAETIEQEDSLFDQLPF